VVGPILLGAAITGATGLCLYLLVKKEQQAIAGRQTTQAQVSISIRVGQDNVPLVLGRQGSNLREIQSRSNTRIYIVPEQETPDHKVLQVTGTADDVQFAEILIHQTISAQPRLVNCVINVPKFASSAVLGRKEETLRQIERRSRCRLESSKAEDGVRLSLQGTKEQVSSAEFLINEKVKEQEYIQNKGGLKLEYTQPLLLTYEEEEPEPIPTHSTQESLKCGFDNMIQVYVSCIADPGRFWVQNVGAGSVQLDRLTETITEYYSDPKNQEFHKVEEVAVGDIVVTSFSGDSSFNRAKIVRVEENEYDSSKTLVDLDFVDFGDFEVKEITQIYSMKPEFLKLKFQAVLCKLAHVRPPEGDMDYSEECMSTLENLTHCAQWKPVLARILSQDVKSESEGNPAVVELFQSSSQGVNIGVELARAGLVRYK